MGPIHREKPVMVINKLSESDLMGGGVEARSLGSNFGDRTRTAD